MMTFLHWLWAFITRNFWDLCPKCGLGFGGHQEFATCVIFKQEKRAVKHFRYVCHRCAPLCLPDPANQ
jgi:hypothetical protein